MNKKLNDSLIKVFFNASESFDNINVCQIVSKFEKKKKQETEKIIQRKRNNGFKFYRKKLLRKINIFNDTIALFNK